MYRSSTPSTAGSSATIRRSARRQTARATCSAAPAGLPPARMKRRSGGSSASNRSISLLEPRHIVVSERRLRDASGDLLAGIGQLRAEREQIALEMNELGVDVRVGA